MRYLMDVNVLVAWGWADHVDHERTARWIAAGKKVKPTVFLTSSIPRLGFVRVSVQRSGGSVTVTQANETLAGMISALGSRHLFLADDRSSLHFPAWCQSAARTTDAHLLQLAEAHDAKLATLDHGIPGAFLIPFLEEWVSTKAKPAQL